ncbi:MAG: hypothetical protein Q4E39_05670 [bacterium]|nr:hypothetical protein [bacterium]
MQEFYTLLILAFAGILIVLFYYIDKLEQDKKQKELDEAYKEYEKNNNQKRTRGEKKYPDGYDCIAKLSGFSKDSWSTIAGKVRLKSYPYKIGDTKIVDVGDLGTHMLRIVNTSECTNG